MKKRNRLNTNNELNYVDFSKSKEANDPDYKNDLKTPLLVSKQQCVPIKIWE